ncbi:MAG: methyltransferase domain-containing protein [Alphaproteobacteria bacterium]|nr:methyltransferase domain-containing protein [Alphaproteobacteria bacterium]
MTTARDPVSRLREARAALASGAAMRAPGAGALAAALESDMPAAALAKKLESVINNAPELFAAKILFAMALDAEGKRDAALGALRATLAEGPPADYDCLCLAADALLDWDAPEEAAAAAGAALALAPHASHAYLRRGRALAAAGDVSGAVEDLRQATLLQPSFAEAHLALARELHSIGRHQGAAESFRRVLALDPHCDDARRGLDAALVAVIPPWHAAMLNDAARAEAYDRAIRRAVKPGMHVLDIGTGTGLLAMMAARAGAGRVTACESIFALADMAEKIIRNNGLNNSINVIRKSSDTLDSVDLSGRADLLVAEILDAGLLGEGMLRSFADARARLLKPGAAVIPQAATVHAAPVECKALYAERRVGTVAGFDLAPFNALAPRLYLQTDLRRYDWRALAAPAPVFSFDFRTAAPAPEETTIPIAATADGSAQLIAFWFTLALDEETTLSTAPDAPPTHWQQAVYALDAPIPVRTGQALRLHAQHDGNTVRLALDTAEG